MITEEQLAKDREPIPYIPVKQLRRDRPLYVMKQTRPHPIRGYGNSHDEFSVVDIRGYRKGYEPRLDILGQYTPNSLDLFRLGTGRLPPYQPTTTGDKLQAEMERLQVHKAWRINPMTPEEVPAVPKVEYEIPTVKIPSVEIEVEYPVANAVELLQAENPISSGFMAELNQKWTIVFRGRISEKAVEAAKKAGLKIKYREMVKGSGHYFTDVYMPEAAVLDFDRAKFAFDHFAEEYSRIPKRTFPIGAPTTFPLRKITPKPPAVEVPAVPEAILPEGIKKDGLNYVVKDKASLKQLTSIEDGATVKIGNYWIKVKFSEGTKHYENASLLSTVEDFTTGKVQDVYVRPVFLDMFLSQLKEITVKPPAVEVAIKHRGTEPEGIAIADELGVRYDGILEGIAELPSQMMFTDVRQTGSTFTANTLEEARTKLADMRAKFARPLVAEAPTPEVERAARIKYFRGEEAKWRETAYKIAEKERGEAPFAEAIRKADEFGRQASELEAKAPVVKLEQRLKAEAERLKEGEELLAKGREFLREGRKLLGPMPPEEGPPLPKILALRWPWKK